MNPIIPLAAMAALALTVFAIYKAVRTPEPSLDIEAPVQSQAPAQAAKPVTMGTIAIGVFLGQLLFAAVGVIAYALLSLLR